jgi:L-alanine-DL-glutamate epimerase-like enolase superfamily enzyme
VAAICPIAEVETIVLRAPTVDADDLDGSSETIVVRIVDREGRSGVGEADAPPQAVRELVEMHDSHAWSRGLGRLLLDRDPFQIRQLWSELYLATIYHGRRGLGLHALSAIDVALHDLAGKQVGRPAYQLLGGARRERVTPYATLYPGAVKGRTLGQMMDALAALAEKALELGFAAVKAELIFGDLVSDRRLVQCIEDVRGLVGEDVTLLVDFGYRWTDWRSALWVLDRVADCDIFLAEATLQHDDLTGHAKLADRVETRVGGAELAASLHECREWLERGRVDVLQPDLNRCGGLTELRRIGELAELHGALVCPHGWKTGITAAAACHFQAATPNAPLIEMLSPGLYDSPLRRDLVHGEPKLENGSFPLPMDPGLGIELDEEVVACYRVTAR